MKNEKEFWKNSFVELFFYSGIWRADDWKKSISKLTVLSYTACRPPWTNKQRQQNNKNDKNREAAKKMQNAL